MFEKYTNWKSFITLVLIRISFALIGKPTIDSTGQALYTTTDKVFNLLSTLVLVLLIIISLNALDNISKNKKYSQGK